MPGQLAVTRAKPKSWPARTRGQRAVRQRLRRRVLKRSDLGQQMLSTKLLQLPHAEPDQHQSNTITGGDGQLVGKRREEEVGDCIMVVRGMT